QVVFEHVRQGLDRDQVQFLLLRELGGSGTGPKVGQVFEREIREQRFDAHQAQAEASRSVVRIEKQVALEILRGLAKVQSLLQAKREGKAGSGFVDGAIEAEDAVPPAVISLQAGARRVGQGV